MKLLTFLQNNRNWEYKYEGLLFFILIPLGIYKWVGISISAVTYGPFYLLYAVLIICVWIWFRHVPSFKLNKIGILLATHQEESLNKEVEQLQYAIVQKLKNISLNALFDIRFLPPNINIKEESAAYKIREVSNAFLIVWGVYEKSMADGNEVKGFAPGNLNFTYRLPPLSDQGVQMFKSDIATAMSNRKWSYITNNEFMERQFISSNITEVAAYIIANGLRSFLYFEEASKIYKDILRRPSGSWVGGNKVSISLNIRSFLNDVRIKCANCLLMTAQKIYDTKLFVNGNLLNDSNSLQEAMHNIDESIQLHPARESYLQRAIFYFLSGNIELSRKAVNKAKTLGGRTWELPYFSLGFLFAYEENFELSLRYYKRGLSLTKNLGTYEIFHLSQFIEAVLKKEPDRYYLNFALGLINKWMLDKMIAREEFEKFIEMATARSLEDKYIQIAKTELESLKDEPIIPEASL